MRATYTAGRLVRFGDASDLTLGKPGCQVDCHSCSHMASILQ